MAWSRGATAQSRAGALMDLRMGDVLQIDRQGSTTILTLNRPQKLHALDTSLVEALLDAITDAGHDGTRLVVLRGAGKGFSAGFDFGQLDEHSHGDLALRFIRLEQFLQAVWRAPLVTMALLHGPCFGAAADLAAACVHRVAAADAKFRMPGLRFGIALGTRRLAHVVGRDAARSILATSRVFAADEALRVGLLTAIAEADAWNGAIEQAARDAAVLPFESLVRLLSLTQPGDDDADFAALVRSLATPGLRDRIEDYLASLKAS